LIIYPGRIGPAVEKSTVIEELAVAPQYAPAPTEANALTENVLPAIKYEAVLLAVANPPEKLQLVELATGGPSTPQLTPVTTLAPRVAAIKMRKKNNLEGMERLCHTFALS
jgi:hypothetical protein